AAHTQRPQPYSSTGAPAATDTYTLSLHDALPICSTSRRTRARRSTCPHGRSRWRGCWGRNWRGIGRWRWIGGEPPRCRNTTPRQLGPWNVPASTDTAAMELSWELEQLGRTAAPDVVLDGRRLVHLVSDVSQHDDGSVDALVRGEHSHTVSLASGFPHD